MLLALYASSDLVLAQRLHRGAFRFTPPTVWAASCHVPGVAMLNQSPICWKKKKTQCKANFYQPPSSLAYSLVHVESSSSLIAVKRDEMANTETATSNHSWMVWSLESAGNFKVGVFFKGQEKRKKWVCRVRQTPRTYENLRARSPWVTRQIYSNREIEENQPGSLFICVSSSAELGKTGERISTLFSVETSEFFIFLMGLPSI